MESTPHRSNARTSDTVTLNKKDALKAFRAETTAKGTERVEAWRRYVEQLHREGRITNKQRETWHLPS